MRTPLEAPPPWNPHLPPLLPEGAESTTLRTFKLSAPSIWEAPPLDPWVSDVTPQRSAPLQALSCAAQIPFRTGTDSGCGEMALGWQRSSGIALAKTPAPRCCPQSRQLQGPSQPRGLGGGSGGSGPASPFHTGPGRLSSAPALALRVSFPEHPNPDLHPRGHPIPHHLTLLHSSM